MGGLLSPLSEVRTVTLGVADLTRALDLYSGVLGFEVLARSPVSMPLAQAWEVPPGVGAEVALLAQPGTEAGRLRLLAFDPPGERIWRAEDRLCGDGLFAVNLRARDVRALLPRLRAAGCDVPDEAVFWEVSEEVAVWDSMSCDPDGIHLDVFTYVRGGEKRGPLAGNVSEVQTVAIATHDVGRCAHFYRSLGFDVLFDLHLENLEDLLDVPSGVVVHNVNLIKTDSETGERTIPGRVECFRYLGPGLPAARSLRDRSRPPRRGILAIGFETADLATADRRLREAGALPAGEAVFVDLPGEGPSSLARYRGPDGETIELIEGARHP